MSQDNTIPPWVNTIMKGLLRSPFHFVASRNIMLLSFTGRKSGKSYTVPVSYLQDGDVITVFTDRAWAKNFRGGAPATVVVRGKTLQGSAQAVEGPQIAAPLAEFLTRIPRDAKYHNVRRSPDGSLDQGDIERAAAGEFMVTVHRS